MFYFGLAKIRRFFIFHTMFNKGISKENLGEYPKALNAFFLALSLCPNSLKTYIAISRVNKKNKTFLNAIDFCNKGISRFPKCSELYKIKADILRKIKNYDEAIESYDIALKFDNSNIEILENRAKLKYYTDNIQGAINDYNEAIRIKPNNYKLYSQIAFYYFLKKDYKNAYKYYKNALNINPNNQHLLYMKDSTEKLLK